MKHCLFALNFALVSLGTALAQDIADNHVDLTSNIIDFLSRTEICLNSCRDADSVNAALTQLQQLKQECDKLVEVQRSLPEPTIQDYMAVQNQMETFSTIWNAIRDHIERLESEHLMTPELRQILHIAPQKPQK